MQDLRLTENLKLFIGGPSRCGKTFFVADFIQNLSKICKEPPLDIIYVFKVWQPKYDELSDYVRVFIKEQDDLVEKIKRHCRSGTSTLIVFDDLINSNSLKQIANLFVVDGRHMKLSLIFLSQRLFVNDEYFR